MAVTYCPLSGTGMAFDARVSGLLYNSDVLLYDRATESPWSQIVLVCVIRFPPTHGGADAGVTWPRVATGAVGAVGAVGLGRFIRRRPGGSGSRANSRR